MDNKIVKTKNVTIHSHNNVKIILISSLIGALAGLVTVFYRILLTKASDLSQIIYAFIRENSAYIPFLFLFLTIAGFALGKLTKKYPLISGSGIPQIKARIMGYIEGSWLSTLIAKFFGGVLAIFCGLSMGMCGPSIQLSCNVAEGVSGKVSSDQSERRIFIASGAAAGLSAAFNAPLAGVMFALEEIFKYFSPMVLLSTMVAAVVADFTSKMFFGIEHIFKFEVSQSIPLEYYWIFLVLGTFIGLSGVIYNFFIVQSQRLYKKLDKIHPQIKPILPFILAGILGLTFPVVLGGGYEIVPELNMSTNLNLLILILVVKFIFTMFCFGSGHPGGIFFPLLILGATCGAIFAKVAIPILGLDEALFYNLVIISMGGYFAAIVRAPLTGIILLTEMTGSMTQLFPMIMTAAIAYIIAEEMKSKPVYEILLSSFLAGRGIDEKPVDKTKIMLETVVRLGSVLDGATVMEVHMPERCLIISIKRGGLDITPNGATLIQAGDTLTVLTSVSQELEVRDFMEHINVELEH